MFVSIATVLPSIIAQKGFSLAWKMGWVLSLWRAGLMGVAQIGKCPVSGPQHRKCWMMPLSQFCGDRPHGYWQIVTPCWLTFTTAESCASAWPIHQMIRASNEIMHLTLFSVRCIYICATSQALRHQTPNLCGPLCALLIVFVRLLGTFCLLGQGFLWKQMQIASTSPRNTRLSHL